MVLVVLLALHVHLPQADNACTEELTSLQPALSAESGSFCVMSLCSTDLDQKEMQFLFGRGQYLMH